MKLIFPYTSYLLAMTISIALNSCTNSSSEVYNNSFGQSQLISSESHSKSPVITNNGPNLKVNVMNSSTSAKNWQSTMKVNLYKADQNCQNLVSENVSVPANDPLKYVINQLLSQPALSSLNLVTYRLDINHQKNIAVIDLHFKDSMNKRLANLSRCEMLALFGALRQTLTTNPNLPIKNVNFTNLGEEVLVTLQE